MSKIEQVFKTTDGYFHPTLERAEVHQKYLDSFRDSRNGYLAFEFLKRYHPDIYEMDKKCFWVIFSGNDSSTDISNMISIFYGEYKDAILHALTKSCFYINDTFGQIIPMEGEFKND